MGLFFMFCFVLFFIVFVFLNFLGGEGLVVVVIVCFGFAVVLFF